MASQRGGKDRKCCLLANRLPLLQHIAGNPVAERRVSATTMAELRDLFERGKGFVETFCCDEKGCRVVLGGIVECFCADSATKEGHSTAMISQILHEIDRCLDRVPLHLILEASQPTRKEQPSPTKPAEDVPEGGGKSKAAGATPVKSPGTPANQQDTTKHNSGQHTGPANGHDTSGFLKKSSASTHPERPSTSSWQQDQHPECSIAPMQPWDDQDMDNSPGTSRMEKAVEKSVQKVPCTPVPNKAAEAGQGYMSSSGAQSALATSVSAVGTSKCSKYSEVAPETSSKSLPYEVPSAGPRPLGRGSGGYQDQAVPAVSNSGSQLHWSQEQEESMGHHHQPNSNWGGRFSQGGAAFTPQQNESVSLGAGIPILQILRRGPPDTSMQDVVEQGGENGGEMSPSPPHRRWAKPLSPCNRKLAGEDEKTPSPPWTAEVGDTEGTSARPNLQEAPSLNKRRHLEGGGRPGGGKILPRGKRLSPAPEFLVPKALAGCTNLEDLVPEASVQRTHAFRMATYEPSAKPRGAADSSRGAMRARRQPGQRPFLMEDDMSFLPPQLPRPDTPWNPYSAPAGWFPPPTAYGPPRAMLNASFPPYPSWQVTSWAPQWGMPSLGAYEDSRPLGGLQLPPQEMQMPPLVPPPMWGIPAPRVWAPSGSGSGLDTVGLPPGKRWYNGGWVRPVGGSIDWGVPKGPRGKPEQMYGEESGEAGSPLDGGARQFERRQSWPRRGGDGEESRGRPTGKRPREERSRGQFEDEAGQATSDPLPKMQACWRPDPRGTNSSPEKYSPARSASHSGPQGVWQDPPLASDWEGDQEARQWGGQEASQRLPRDSHRRDSPVPWVGALMPGFKLQEAPPRLPPPSANVAPARWLAPSAVTSIARAKLGSMYAPYGAPVLPFGVVEVTNQSSCCSNTAPGDEERHTRDEGEKRLGRGASWDDRLQEVEYWGGGRAVPRERAPDY